MADSHGRHTTKLDVQGDGDGGGPLARTALRFTASAALIGVTLLAPHVTG